MSGSPQFGWTRFVACAVADRQYPDYSPSIVNRKDDAIDIVRLLAEQELPKRNARLPRLASLWPNSGRVIETEDGLFQTIEPSRSSKRLDSVDFLIQRIQVADRACRELNAVIHAVGETRGKRPARAESVRVLGRPAPGGRLHTHPRAPPGLEGADRLRHPESPLLPYR